jgi:transposase InsO family protein
MLGVVARIARRSACSTTKVAATLPHGSAVTDSTSLQTASWRSTSRDCRSAVTRADVVLGTHNGVRLSVGRRGQCWDNAVAESFFATIKTELLDRRPWPTRAAAHKAIFNWIEGISTTPAVDTPHWTICPAAYEAKLNQQPDLRRVA